MKMKRMKLILCTLFMSAPLVLSGCRHTKDDAFENRKIEEENVLGENILDENMGAESITPEPTPQALAFTEKMTVCLDAGHGFSDPGCESSYLNGYEADITLDVVKILKEKLEAEDVEVLLTHDGKTFPSAQEVKNYANEQGIRYSAKEIKANNIFSAYERAVYCQALDAEVDIDLFVSLHVNSGAGHPEVSRYDAYYSKGNPFAAELRDFCAKLEPKLDNTLLVHAEEKKNAMLVVKYAKFPAILLEMGFGTNESDAAKLNSPEWRTDYANLLAQEIIDFVSKN